MPGTVRRWNYPPPLCIGKNKSSSILQWWQILILNSNFSMAAEFHLSKWGFYTWCSFHTQFSIMKVIFFYLTPQVSLHQERTCRCSLCIPDHDCLNYGYGDHLHQQLPDYLKQIVLRLTFNPPPWKTMPQRPVPCYYFPLLASDTIPLLLLLQSQLFSSFSRHFYNIYPSVAEDKRMKQQRNSSRSVTGIQQSCLQCWWNILSVHSG